MLRARIIVAAVVLVAIGAVGVATRSGGVDRDEYVANNVRLLDSLPVYPGARAVGTTSSRCTAGDSAGADVDAYWTWRRYDLSPRASKNDVARFFSRRLASWRDVAGGTQGASPYLGLRAGRAYVHVAPGDGTYAVGVQHDYRACY